MAEPPAPEELWEEILLRLPPDDPASLLRASLVCKQWRRIVTRRGFLRRLAQLHRAPPILGFFDTSGRLVLTTAGSAFPLPFTAPDRRPSWYFLDCRHGRALLLDESTVTTRSLLVWEPVTGYQRRVPFPANLGCVSFNAAVLCAADGCGHRCCRGGPFRVVFVWHRNGGGDPVASAREYSSETGSWGEPTLIPITPDSGMYFRPTILLGNSLYFLHGSFGEEIIKYDLGGQARVIDNYLPGARLMHAEDGGLGIALVEGSSLQLWSRQMGDNADAGWVLGRTIHLENLLPAAASARVAGFAEGADVILLRTKDCTFTIEPKSGRVRKMFKFAGAYPLLPFVSFYAPGIQADAGEQG